MRPAADAADVGSAAGHTCDVLTREMGGRDGVSVHLPVFPRLTRPLEGPRSSQKPVLGLTALPSARRLSSTCHDARKLRC